MNRCNIIYKEAEPLIREGDVLLFRRSSFASYVIRLVGESPYSHAGLASWVFNEQGERARLECVEFKEWIGGRALSLENYVKQNPGAIDVFTPNLYHAYTSFNCITKNRDEVKTYFKGRLVTDELRRLTGLPYGWSRIWEIAKRNLIPIVYSDYYDIPDEELIYPVCSTAIAYCYQKHFADLTHLRPLNRMEPADLAKSPILNYVFTLLPNPDIDNPVTGATMKEGTQPYEKE